MWYVATKDATGRESWKILWDIFKDQFGNGLHHLVHVLWVRIQAGDPQVNYKGGWEWNLPEFPGRENGMVDTWHCLGHRAEVRSVLFIYCYCYYCFNFYCKGQRLNEKAGLLTSMLGFFAFALWFLCFALQICFLCAHIGNFVYTRKNEWGDRKTCSWGIDDAFLDLFSQISSPVGHLKVHTMAPFYATFGFAAWIHIPLVCIWGSIVELITF